MVNICCSPPRQNRGFDVGAAVEVFEHVEHRLHRPTARAILLSGLQTQRQVLPRGETGKDIAVLGHIADPHIGDLERFLAADLLPLKLDRSFRFDLAHDGLAGGGPPHPVAPQKRDDLAFFDVQVHPLKDVGLAVEGVHIRDFEHH